MCLIMDKEQCVLRSDIDSTEITTITQKVMVETVLMWIEIPEVPG